MLARYLSAALLFCGACSWSAPQGTGEAAATISYQLYLSNVSAQGSSFEQYRHLPAGMFVECGEGSRGREKAREQGVVTVSADQARDAQELARRVIVALKGASSTTFDKDIADSSDVTLGTIVLALKSDDQFSELHTSIASAVDGDDDGPVAVRELIEFIRGLPERVLCKREDFFGLSR